MRRKKLKYFDSLSTYSWYEMVVLKIIIILNGSLNYVDHVYFILLLLFIALRFELFSVRLKCNLMMGTGVLLFFWTKKWSLQKGFINLFILVWECSNLNNLLRIKKGFLYLRKNCKRNYLFFWKKTDQLVNEALLSSCFWICFYCIY